MKRPKFRLIVGCIAAIAAGTATAAQATRLKARAAGRPAPAVEAQKWIVTGGQDTVHEAQRAVAARRPILLKGLEGTLAVTPGRRLSFELPGTLPNEVTWGLQRASNYAYHLRRPVTVTILGIALGTFTPRGRDDVVASPRLRELENTAKSAP